MDRDHEGERVKRDGTNQVAETAAPRSVAEFRERLRRLHTTCGAPRNAEIRRAIRGVAVPQLAASTLSEFFSDARPGTLPRQDFVRAFVAGCLLHDDTSPDTVDEALTRWDTWWCAVVAGTGQPPIKVVVPPSTTRPPGRARIRVVLLATVCVVAGFAAGALVFGWDRSPWSADPSLVYDTCAEKIHYSRVVGQTTLIADRGPHGRPIQDRRIELRTQQHPQHGWIVWSHLAETPSPIDRLWLDWSYRENPDGMDEFRQCGAQPISDGPDTPALLARDTDGRPRWFRACGQVYPLEHRAPSMSGTFCTSWTRPHT